MNLKMIALAAGCSLALAACSNNASAPNADAPAANAPTTETATPEPAPDPAAEPAAAAPAAAAANGKPAAVVTNCSTVIKANDAMQYDVGSITVPASCTEFKITLEHTGKLPVSAMGHDVVITSQADMAAVDQAGMAAGLDAGYIKADDPRIIAHTKLIGGGETTSTSFAVSKIQTGGPFVFFCSFPGHSAVMHGTISVQ